MDEHAVALVTGANQGIGFEIAKGLAAHGFTVLVGSRNLGRGQEAARKIGASAVALQLDVTDRSSIEAAARRIDSDYGRLDVLVQNAAIAMAGDRAVESPEAHIKANRPSNVVIEDMRAVWDTNVFGVLSVYQAMVPILKKTTGSRIVNVSSGLGSLTLNSPPDSPYRQYFDVTYAVSKTALNGLTLAMAIELEPDGIKVNAVTPGPTNTKLTGFAGGETPEQGAAEAIRVAVLGADAPTGSFTHATFGVVPW